MFLHRTYNQTISTKSSVNNIKNAVCIQRAATTNTWARSVLMTESKRETRKSKHSVNYTRSRISVYLWLWYSFENKKSIVYYISVYTIGPKVSVKIRSISGFLNFSFRWCQHSATWNSLKYRYICLNQTAMWKRKWK